MREKGRRAIGWVTRAYALVVPDGRMRGFKERRLRRTRRALYWQYSSRLYLLASVIPIFGFFGGLDLVSKQALWQRAVGAFVLIATAFATAMLVRWLMLPVDEESRERRRQYYEEMRLWKPRKDRRASRQARDPRP